MLSCETVQLGHGSGGAMMKRLIDEVFLEAFDAPELHAGNDAGVAALPPTGRIALSTDTFVVTPHTFPGGDIGRLAVCGTVNDVATSGAHVRYLSCGFVIEEGFPLDDLRRICKSMAEAAREANVAIITGDTKVVERGCADGIYLNTAGVGDVPECVNLASSACEPGDIVLVSGTLGDHGIAIMSVREGLSFQTSIVSDAAPAQWTRRSGARGGAARPVLPRRPPAGPREHPERVRDRELRGYRNRRGRRPRAT